MRNTYHCLQCCMGVFKNKVTNCVRHVICSDLTQEERQKALDAFALREKPVMFTTDVISHGYDNQSVELARRSDRV